MSNRATLVNRNGARETERTLVDDAQGLAVMIDDNGGVTLELYPEHPRGNSVRLYISPEAAQDAAPQWARWARITRKGNGNG